MDDFTQRMNELEERIDYLEKKFNVNRNASELLFPKTVKVVDAVKTEQNSTDGE